MSKEPTPVPPTMLDYAPVVKGRALRRWVNRLLIVLAVGAAALLPWYGLKWRLKQDEMAFKTLPIEHQQGQFIFLHAR